MYFYLKEPKSNKDTLIILKYFISKSEGRFTLSTGLNINPEFWDFENKKAKLKKGNSSLSRINRKLQTYIDELDKTINYFELNDIKVTRENLKKAFANNDDNKIIYFSEFAKEFIEKAPNLINRNTKKKYTSRKIQHYLNTLNKFIAFEKLTHKRIRLDGFSLSVYDKFVDYLLNNENLSVNTTGEAIKNIKVLLKKAEEFGNDVHQDYKHSNFTVLKEESIAITINEDEIEELMKLDLSQTYYLENTRDLAIIGLWTGLRVSDFLSLPEIKQDDKFITVTTKKTKAKVVIPLHKHIKEVIKLRGMPKMISEVKFNKYIKEVCEKAKFNELVKGSLMVYNDDLDIYRKKTDYYEKYKLVSSHTCRRSFATNLYKMGFPTLSIMQITGHTTEKSFLTYIKVTPTEHAEKLLELWEEYYKSNQ